MDDLKVDLEGQRSRSPGQKRDVRPHWSGLQLILEVKVSWVKLIGHMGQGQRSCESRSPKGQGQKT